MWRIGMMGARMGVPSVVRFEKFRGKLVRS